MGRESPCRTSLYGKKAGEGKLVGQEEPLPDKLIRKEGRGEKASWAGRTPAEQAYKERRQGWGKLVGQGEPLPSKLIRKEGRGGEACWAGKPGAAPLRIVQIVSWWSY